jgi:hypothetical protein
MDANTQIASDVHFLVAPLRFIWRSIFWAIFLLIAPVLYLTVPFVLVALAPSSDFGVLALAYLALGPFVASFWLIITRMISRYRRLTADGSPYEASLEGVFVACGWMILGFFGSIAAELIFGFIIGFPRTGNTSGWAAWFAAAPFVTFSPVLLGWMWRRLK